jgi:hypothetical protein
MKQRMESPSAMLAVLAVIIAQATARVVLFWAIFSHTSPRWSSLRPSWAPRKLIKLCAMQIL